MKLSICIFISSLFLMSGCTTLQGPADEHDPYESFNRSMYSFNGKLDKYALKPVAQGYNYITPQPVKKGVSNFFSNLDDFVVIINDLLQLKVGQFFSDTGRLLINSTIGLYGLIDWASDIGLEKHDEDFGQTLGYWGVPTGNYLVLPFFGPGNFRDSAGLSVDRNNLDPVSNEIHEGTPFPDRDSDVSFTLTAVDAINTRSKLLKAERLLDQAALDPYIFVREAYLQRRYVKVHDGDPPLDFYDDDVDFDYVRPELPVGNPEK